MAIELRELVGKFKTGEEVRGTREEGRRTIREVPTKPPIVQKPQMTQIKPKPIIPKKEEKEKKEG